MTVYLYKLYGNICIYTWFLELNWVKLMVKKWEQCVFNSNFCLFFNSFFPSNSAVVSDVKFVDFKELKFDEVRS